MWSELHSNVQRQHLQQWGKGFRFNSWKKKNIAVLRGINALWQQVSTAALLQCLKFQHKKYLNLPAVIDDVDMQGGYV